MKDLEPILGVLTNYHAGYVLSEDEIFLLREWLQESTGHEKFFDQLNKGMEWMMGSIDGNIREKILNRLVEMEEEI